MGASLHQVNPDICKGDGICVEVCPKNIYELADEKARPVEALADGCIFCGQCIAACPSDAITMPDLPAQLFTKLDKWSFGHDDLHAFLSERRSVRKFKDRPVDRALIEKIVQTASTAPMGWPPHTTEILVIDDRAELDRLCKDAVADYTKLLQVVSIPVIRSFIKWKIGAELFGLLKDYIIPVAKAANEDYAKDGTDQYMYHAPVLMLFHANRWTASYEENAHLVCAYAMLAAQSLGLGTTIIGMIPPIVDQSKSLRQRYAIPKDNKVITSLILGHPKYKYKKSIQREFPSVRFFGS